MAWFKVDDHMTFHPKIISCGNEAIGAWTRLGAYCGAHLTDGKLPTTITIAVCERQEIVERLITIGLLERNQDGSYQIHDYLQYNPSAEQVKAERAAAAERQAKHRQRNGVTNTVSHTVSNPHPDPTNPTRPTPTDPVPTQPDQNARGRAGWLAGLYDKYPRQGNFEKGAEYVRALTDDDRTAFTNAVTAYAQKIADEQPEPRWVTTWPKFCEKKWRDYTRLPAPRRNGTGMGEVRAPVDKTRKERL